MKALSIAIIMLILTSCASTATEEEGFLEKGYAHTGEEAAMIYLEGIAEAPSPELWYNLAYSYLEAKDYDAAVEAANEAKALYPDMIRFDYLELYAYRESGMMHSYEKALEALHERYPANDTVAEMLLRSYAGARREKGIAVARALLERNPSNATAIRILGEFYPFYEAISTYSPEISEEQWDVGPTPLYDITNVIEDRLLPSP